ncbi:solute carrier family 36 (proton-coupled amino acid transporter) [Strigomonas culicis]|uniref:Solute carrier family 36 (Proton-coupled amino acid transporter) n=1 Tax=Strigomonas culicis TaxID=28005 RepID=S9TSI0_9TRYP|nr:solute carrier family 36 (proton-coupled amino acid transporter) [Strigomonas culicis]|eukprot:EPY19519.1 solute carrier family 36 (proton-coupled amino acid transporter) [Strigomonas culicis]
MNEEDQQRRALIEGFINMSDMEALRDEDDSRIFTKSGANAKNAKGNDYVVMDEDDMSSVGRKETQAGELRENTSIFKSAFHVFKANVGTGVFMLPTFYKDSGYILAPILGVVIGLIVVDCTHNLLNTKTRINRRDCTTYSQIAHYVFGPAMAWFLFIALCLTQFGFCLMYSQLASATMDNMLEFNTKSHYLWVSLVLLICFPMTCYSDNLSLLGIGSLIATICVFYALISCLVQSLMTIHANGGMSKTCNAKGTNIPVGYFNTLANNMMVLEGIAVVLPVHAACTQKRLMSPMITIVLICVIAWYLIFGLIGYLAYGTTLTESLVNVMDLSAVGYINPRLLPSEHHPVLPPAVHVRAAAHRCHRQVQAAQLGRPRHPPAHQPHHLGARHGDAVVGGQHRSGLHRRAAVVLHGAAHPHDGAAAGRLRV